MCDCSWLSLAADTTMCGRCEESEKKDTIGGELKPTRQPGLYPFDPGATDAIRDTKRRESRPHSMIGSR